ncbi:MAG: poly-gamma-glutamate biosynthesis protein PgsC [Syntrophales bacterium]|jgi:poly-gamma-glutamate biosynthesis protein PgsC/CapC|nr:poly-gamma-glutamate biosynthesis protein PgsC [Syntrophales bacterium]
MNLAESIAIGLVLGFFFYEWVGLSAGGFVVPGYIALQLGSPLLLVGTLMTSLLTYASVKAASRYIILYGRRRFILMVLAGFAWQWLFKAAVIQQFVLTTDTDILGFIIPGLIANEMDRQRILPTLLTLLIISIMVRLVLIGLGAVRM